MTTAGTFVAGYPFPTPTSSLAITAGPNGNVWFGEWDYSKIAQVTRTGVITEYVVAGARISGITTGPDGNIWFSSRDGWVGYIEVEVGADTTPPEITVPDDLTVNATSPSGAIVPYEVTASDDTDPSPTVVCAPANGGTFPIGVTMVNCTATDATGNQATASFKIVVKGAAEQLVDLYNAARVVGPGTSLPDKVKAAQAAHTAGDVLTCRDPQRLHPSGESRVRQDDRDRDGDHIHCRCAANQNSARLRYGVPAVDDPARRATPAGIRIRGRRSSRSHREKEPSTTGCRAARRSSTRSAQASCSPRPRSTT